MNHTFLSKFDYLMQTAAKNLGQCRQEWFAFLEFALGYFKAHDILCPVVVEIGVWRNAQKPFYEELLGAEYIGIDIDRKANPTILGDSQATRTVGALKDILAGRQIDLLFIDGHHSYAGVKGDYEIYAPMTKHIVAIHDILSETHPEVKVIEFWKELWVNDKHLHLVFHRRRAHEKGTPWDGHEMGIGVVVKG